MCELFSLELNTCMAVIKLTANTRDAQQKVQKLRKDVERLDREAKKPKKINVQGKSVLGKIGGTMGNALSVAGGNIMSDILKGMMRYIPAVVRVGSGILGKALGLKELETAVTRITPKIRNLVTALEAYGSPGEEALERADKLDALDDERRSHNSKSLAEEFAYSKAFSNIAGVNGTQIVDRLQSVLDMATSGNISEMEKAWGQLAGFGIRYKDVQEKSTWEILSMMLKAYRRAGADGNNELEPAMQQIVGKRQMAAIRKIGDGKELEAQAKELRKEFDTRIQNQDKILEEAAKSEVTRAKAEIQGMAIPAEGLHFINDEANTQLSLNKLKTGMIGDTGTAGEALWDLVGEIGEDLQPAIDEIKEKSIKNALLNMIGLGDDEEEGSTHVDHANIDVNSANMDVQSATPLLVEPPTEIQTGGNLSLHPLEPNLPLPSDTKSFTLDPIKESYTGTSTLPKHEIATPSITGTGETFTGNVESLKTTLDELTKSIRDNTSSNNRATDAFSNLSSFTSVTTGGTFQP